MTLSERDQAAIWHPYTQMHTAPAPLPIVRGEGARLFLENGDQLLDAISSWWVTVHGHAHPHIADAIGKQAHTLEQVIFAGCTHPQAVRIAERLLSHLPPEMARVFFTDDGSTAVEVGVKMAWQYWQNKGQKRKRIISLDHAYHGDTFGAMSVSGRSVFTQAFAQLLFDVHMLPSPADVDEADLLTALDAALADDSAVAMIVEPLVQGAGGMRMYPASTLDKMTRRCQEKGVPVIFDEVMTGFYRTGTLFAAHQCAAAPDIICLSKGLTGGFLPMALTVCTEEIYAAFLSDDKGKMLFHGHSFTGNSLGCAAANASLDLFEQPETQAAIAQLVALQAAAGERFAAHPRVHHVRQAGTILAMDLRHNEQGGYLNRDGHRLADAMQERGVLLRPLGDVVYIMPPYTISPQDLQYIHDALAEELEKL